MSPLKAVLFDIDDTLFSTTEFAKRARSNSVRAMREAGLRLPQQELEHELEEVIREFSSNYHQHFDKLLMRLPTAAHAGVNPALIVSAGVVAYHDTKFQELKPFPDVKPLLRALRAAGIRTGIVTHGLTTKQAEKLVRLGLLDFFDPEAIFISDQVGISKPNPKLYALALRELGLSAAEVMYVGDNLANDIAPPNSLGMLTTWARRAARAGQDPDEITPDHVVEDFRELAAILREQHGVPLAEF
jgi:putative hydrolase of the HAD superfamily